MTVPTHVPVAPPVSFLLLVLHAVWAPGCSHHVWVAHGHDLGTMIPPPKECSCSPLPLHIHVWEAHGHDLGTMLPPPKECSCCPLPLHIHTSMQGGQLHLPPSPLLFPSNAPVQLAKSVPELLMHVSSFEAGKLRLTKADHQRCGSFSGVPS